MVVTVLSNDFDAFVSIHKPGDEQPLATDDDSAGGTDAELSFTLPEAGYAAGWEVIIDTASGVPGTIHPPKKEIEVRDHAVVVLRSTG